MTQAAPHAAEVKAMTPQASPLIRWFRPRAAASASAPSSSLRTQVQPPSLRQAPASRWQRTLFWLMSPVPREAAPPVSRLGAVRADFHAAVADLTQPREAGLLVQRIESCRTLRELWHVRTEVYRLVALQHSQCEADSRLARLNRHFPTRSPRSGFMPL